MSILSDYKAFGYSYSNEINTDQIKTSRLFKFFNKEDLELFQDKKRPSTIHYHNLGVSEEDFNRHEILKETLTITSFGYDQNKRKFINSIESKDFSKNKYFGVQFHPEKSSFSKLDRELSLNSIYTLQVSNLIGLGFINEVNNHQRLYKRGFSDKEFKEFGGFSSYEYSLGADQFFYVFDGYSKNIVPINLASDDSLSSIFILFLLLVIIILSGILIYMYLTYKTLSSSDRTLHTDDELKKI